MFFDSIFFLFLLLFFSSPNFKRGGALAPPMDEPPLPATVCGITHEKTRADKASCSFWDSVITIKIVSMTKIEKLQFVHLIALTQDRKYSLLLEHALMGSFRQTGSTFLPRLLVKLWPQHHLTVGSVNFNELHRIEHRTPSAGFRQPYKPNRFCCYNALVMQIHKTSLWFRTHTFTHIVVSLYKYEAM